MKIRLALIILICMNLVLAACTASSTPSPIPVPSHTQTSRPTSTSTPIPTPTPSATPTITPTLTPTPTSIYIWGNFPGPSEDSPIEILPPVDPIAFSPDTVNIALLGTDHRTEFGGYRTDTIIIASLNPSEGTGTLFSIPRDLYVYIPGWRVQRINTSEPHGKFEMFANTILYNFGIPIHHWVKVKFWGLTDAVDLLGGVNVLATGYLYDECGGTYYEYFSGRTYSMDGPTALCYIRMRKNSSDFDRLRRGQEVVTGMFSKVVSLEALEKVPEFFELFNDTFETDMSLDDLLPLVPLAASLATNSDDIRRFRIEPSMTDAFRVPVTGAAVLLPKRDAIDALLEEAFGD
jgi:LCP family protein required for cell wall assembly